MKPFRWMFVIGLAFSVSAQETEPARGEDTLILPVSAQAEALLEPAREAARRQRWETAAVLYQRVLDRHAGEIVQAGGNRFLPVWRVVEREIGTFPPEGREIYRKRSEPTAAALFREAVRKRDMERIEETSRRFRWTESGAEALDLLIDRELSRREYADALRDLESLHRIRYGQQGDLPWKETLRLADALAGVRDAERLLEVLIEAAQRFKEKRQKPPKEWEFWKGKALRLAREKKREPAAERTAFPPPERLFPEKWGAELRWPPFQPGIRWGTGDLRPLQKEPVPAVDLDRVFVQNGYDVAGFSLKGGRRIFASPFKPMPYELEHGFGPQVERRVAVDSDWIHVNLPVEQAQFNHPFQKHFAFTLPRQDLFAFKPDGTLIWQAGRVPSEEEEVREFLRSVSFAGPPVLQNGRLYAGATSFSGMFQSYMTAFDSETGTLLWKRFLCSGQQEMSYFGRPVRESVPSPAAVESGRLYVSTQLGVVACLQEETGEIRWGFRYEQIPLKNQGTEYVDVELRLSGWADNPPGVYDRRVVFAPTDSPFVYGLESGSGRLIWKFERSSPFTKEAYRYILHDRRSGLVLLYGGEKIAALDAQNGKRVWEREVEGAGEWYRGTIRGGEAFIPCDRGVFRVKTETGKVSGWYEWRADQAGSVEVAGTLLISATRRGLHAWDLARLGEPLDKPEPLQ